MPAQAEPEANGTAASEPAASEPAAGETAAGETAAIELAADGTAATVAIADQHFWKPMLTALTVVTLAEFGDITQVLIANLSARYKDALSVFVGASVGFCIVTVFGVVTGRTLTRIVPLALIRRLSGLTLAGFGVYTLVTLLQS